MLANLLLQFGL